MPNPRKDVEPGSQRAAEMVDAMKGIPGYSDDSMFYAARYSDRAKHTLRSADYNELLSLTHQLNIIRSSSGDQSRAAEVRDSALQLLEHFPELARDYDKFATCMRTTAAALQRKPAKDK